MELQGCGEVGGGVGGHKVMVESCVHLEAPFSPLAFQLVDGLVFIFTSINVRLVGGGRARCLWWKKCKILVGQL